MGQFLPVEVLVRYANPGDILEFDRGIYIHYAIYSGKRKVIHLSPNITEEQAKKLGFQSNSVELFSSLFNQYEFKAICKEEHIREVARLDYVRINNKEDEARKRNFCKRDVNVCLKMAQGMVGDKVNYHFLKNNCEKMVTRCKYDSEGWCTQIEELTKSIEKVATFYQEKILKFLKEHQLELSLLLGETVSLLLNKND